MTSKKIIGKLRARAPFFSGATGNDRQFFGARTFARLRQNVPIREALVNRLGCHWDLRFLALLNRITLAGDCRPMTAQNHKSVAKAPRILIVDDDAGQRSLLDSFLRSQGFDTLPVPSGERALEVLQSQEVSMMISDVRMPGLTGLETLRRARQQHAVLPVLLVTAYADIREAVGAMRDGALNYLAKPIDLDELLATVRQVTGLSKSVPLKFSADKQLPPHVVAKSPRMQAVFHEASLIAPSESRVLITGESGVGKEVVADVVHGWSSRAAGPLVKLNCAAIPENLLESELFGHEK